MVTSPVEEHYWPLADSKLYCLVAKADKCKYLALYHCAVVPGQDSNPPPVNRKSVVLLIEPPCLLNQEVHDAVGI